MAISARFARTAANLSTAHCYLPCACGQVHYGPYFQPNTPSTYVKCTLCRQRVRFDLAHVGSLPQEDYRIFARHLPCQVTKMDPVSAGLSLTPGLIVGNRRTWRIGPGRSAPVMDNRLLGVFDAQGALIHLGYYELGRLIRGAFLHHESGFVQYRSSRSIITYERGLVEGPFLPAMHRGDAIAIVHRSFRVWRRRLLKRVISGARVRDRDRISEHLH